MGNERDSGNQRRGRGTWLQWATLLVCAATLAVVIVFMVARGRSTTGERADERIALAVKMLNQGLPAEAIREYEAALDLAHGQPKRRANICYLIGKTYFETFKDYEKALAYFARAKYYNPNHPQHGQMEKWSVACLEKLGRSLDAHNRMVRATALRPSDEPASGTVVARIGDESITLADLEAEIRRLPPEEQKKLAQPAAKRRFLEEYVSRRLLVDAAERAGLTRDPAVLQQIDQARDNILLAAYYQREIQNKVNIMPDEVKLYYEAHRDEFLKPREYTLSHIELPDEAAATSVAETLDGGAEFAALAREESVNRETGEKGGRIGTWTEGQPLPAPLGPNPDIRRAVAGLEQGERTPPLKAESGAYHIVRADAVSTPTARPFEEVRRQIEFQRAQMQRSQRYEEVLARLREAQDVMIFPEALEGKNASK